MIHLVCGLILQDIVQYECPKNNHYFKEIEMPLKKGAKQGSKGFKDNIKTEMAAGKPQRQSVAIAYAESGEKRKKKKKK